MLRAGHPAAQIGGMPPLPLEYQGRELAAGFLSARRSRSPGGGSGRFRGLAATSFGIFLYVLAPGADQHLVSSTDSEAGARWGRYASSSVTMASRVGATARPAAAAGSSASWKTRAGLLPGSTATPTSWLASAS